MNKKILLIRNAHRHDFGGGELFPINLAAELIQNNYQPIIVSSNPRLLRSSKGHGFKSVRGWWWSQQDWSGLRTLLTPLYFFWQIILVMWYIKLIVTTRAAVVHPQSKDDFIAATLAAKLLRRMVIWSDHADLKHIYQNHPVWYKNPVGKLVYLVGKLADHVTIESFSEKKLIEAALGKELPNNYSVIHIGVVDRHTPKKRKGETITLVSTSRLVIDKGISDLIESFKSIDTKNTILKLCGDGPDAPFFKTQAQGTNNIEFLGHVDNVTEQLEDADIFVHPTYHEGFGLSLVEAEMCNLPIIASNVGSIPEIVDDGKSGILVPAKDIEALANAIKTLVSNIQLRIKMGKAGRQIYLDNFQFDKIVKERFIPLYEK